MQISFRSLTEKTALLSILMFAPLARASHFDFFSVDSSVKVECHGLQNAEAVLKVDYSISCDQDPEGHDSIRGIIEYNNSPIKVAFDLYSYKGQTEISLGTAPPKGEETIARIQVPGFQNHCQLHHFKTVLQCEDLKISDLDSLDEQKIMAQLAITHAPYIGYRDDQYTSEKFTDSPLIMTYSILPGNKASQTRKLQYNVIFSDEDTQASARNIREQAKRYGRTVDIEWIYEIEFTKDFQVKRRVYQGFPHRTLTFKGQYLPHSAHPILYDVSTNNNFSDKPYSLRQKEDVTGHLLIPRLRLKKSIAREWAMLEEPWTFKASWAEMVRSGRSSKQIQPENQLFVFADQTFYRGRLDRWLELSEGEILQEIKDGKTLASTELVARLRDDFWHYAQSYWKGELFTAIPIGEKNLDNIEATTITATFRTERAAWIQEGVKKNEGIRFFRLVPENNSYTVREITDKITNLFYGEDGHSPFEELIPPSNP